MQNAMFCMLKVPVSALESACFVVQNRHSCNMLANRSLYRGLDAFLQGFGYCLARDVVMRFLKIIKIRRKNLRQAL